MTEGSADNGPHSAGDTSTRSEGSTLLYCVHDADNESFYGLGDDFGLVPLVNNFFLE